MNTHRLSALYRRELLENVLPFWQRHSPDRRHGGYFTCLDRKGKVYDRDKFIWLQARQVWMFSSLFNRMETLKSWLNTARLGAEFLRAKGRDENGKWYFSLTEHGTPLVQPYNIFSDCFAAMAFAQYALASGEEWAADIAGNTFTRILRRQKNPKGKYEKTVTGTRPLLSFSLPMIMVNLSFELEGVVPQSRLDRASAGCVDVVFDSFLNAKTGLIHEHIAEDGSHPDCFDGRLLNPGHAIEAMWFVMDYGARHDQPHRINQAIDVALNTLEYAWDRKFGGIYYFLDADGRPPQQLEWDQKLWWVHCEALVALCLGYSLTGRRDCLRWLERVHDYTWSRFRDRQYGEWFGYLNRRGEVLMPLKGGKWKGCFHVPRALWRCSEILKGQV